MSEETKKTPQAEEPAVEPNTAEQAAPETAPEQAAAPETNAEAADPKKKDGFFNKKARELEAVKAKLDAAEKNANQAKDQLLRMAAEYENYRMFKEICRSGTCLSWHRWQERHALGNQSILKKRYRM